MDAVLARANLLFDQGRYDLAENEARRALAEQPDDGYGHALLALCLLKRKDFTQALREVSEAVRLNPTVAYSHFVAGHVLLAADRHEDAMRAAEAAIAFGPNYPSHYGLQAAIHLDRRRWAKALAAAEMGLAIDPEHIECSNVRSMALVKLGRRAEAGASIQRTLAINPEDAFTHANKGWTLLHERKPKEAMEHFREALRLDPTMDWARAGIVEALKAKNFIYRWMLAYFLFMSRLSSQAQWAIVMGGWLGMQVLQQMNKANPRLAPFTEPLIWAYIIFAVLTWLADPFFNLMLRLSRYGRLALSREQKIAANWVGLVLLVTLLCIVAYFVFRWDLLINAAIMAGLLTLPVSGIFKVPKGWPQWVMIGATAVLIGIAAVHLWRMTRIGGLGTTVLQKDWDQQQLLTTYAWGILIVTFGRNALAGVRIKKG